MLSLHERVLFVIFFNDTATTEIYTLSLHDALPICSAITGISCRGNWARVQYSLMIGSTCSSMNARTRCSVSRDRTSTRLNSSHANISYAVLCLKKKTIFECSFSLCSYRVCQVILSL